MNTTLTTRILGVMVGVTVAALVTAPVVIAGGSDQASDTKTLELHRAEAVLGNDVMASDGAKVGDIVDFVLRFDGTPRISHVLVMTGGFLDMGGDVRAVPADKISIKNGRTEIATDAATFRKAPLVSRDRSAFFGNAALVRRVDDYFDSTNASSDQAAKAESQLALYSGLNQNRAIGADGRDLGTVTDIWLNLNANRVPLVEVTPTIALTGRFEHVNRLRYELPATRYAGTNDAGATYRFTLSTDDLQDIPSVSAVDNATINYGTTLADSVVKLEVPKNRGQS